MEPQYNPDSPTPEKDNSLRGAVVTEQLLSDLRDQIARGLLRPGDPVKPVRELTKAYGISYNSVRRVLTQLAGEGLVSLERGRGTFVRGPGNAGQVSASTASPSPSVSPSLSHSPSPSPASAVSPPVPVPISSALSQPRVDAPYNPASNVPAPQVPTFSPAPPSIPNTSEAAHGTQPMTLLSGRQSYALLAPAQGRTRIFGFDAALSALQNQVLENGDCLTLIPCHPRKGWPFPDELQRIGFEGVLLFGFLDEEILNTYAASELPTILINQWQEDLPLTGVVADNFSGGYLLTKKMMNVGHREFCLLLTAVAEAGAAPGRQQDSNAVERINACRLALKEEGLSLRDSHLVFVPPACDAVALAERIEALHPRPSAFLVGNKLLADTLVAALRSRGLTAPVHYSVATFSGKGTPNPMSYACAEIDFRKMGEAAVNRMRQLLAGAPAGRLRINIPVDVEPGRTVGPFGRR